MATYKNQKTYNISPTSGNTERDGVNAHEVALNAGPSTPVRNYGGKILPNSGGGRIGNVRLKPGVTVKDVYR